MNSSDKAFHPFQALVFETLETELKLGVATIWLNRPEQRNALNRQMCLELIAALQSALSDDSVLILLIRGRGQVFCAGADLHERKHMTPEQVKERRLLAFDAYGALEAFTKPCIAVVEGLCIGSGAEIATSCDFVLATERTSFRYPEVAWGTIGATQRLPEIVGKRAAKELLFSGRVVLAQEAYDLGIISRLVQTDALALTLSELCEAITRSPPQALRSAKQCVNLRFEEARNQALMAELNAIDEMLSGSQWRGRIQEFRDDQSSA